MPRLSKSGARREVAQTTPRAGQRPNERGLSMSARRTN